MAEGLLTMLNPSIAENPLYGFFDQRRNRISGALLGGIGAESPMARLRGMSQGALKGQEADTAYQTELQKQKEQEDQINRTVQYLQQNRPDLAQQVEAGMPVAEAWKMLNSPAGGADASFSQTPVFLTDAEGNPHIAQMSSGGGILLNGQVVNTLPEGWTVTNRPQAMSSVDLGGSRAVFNPNTGQFMDGPVVQGKPGTNMNVEGAGMDRTMAPAGGSPEDLQRIQADQARDVASRQADERAAFVIHHIDQAVDKSSFGTTGPLGSMGRSMGIPPAIELETAINPIVANLGFQELQAMREASPTGGALGQVTERELAMLQSTVASLDPRQGEAQLDANLRLVKNLLQRNQIYRMLDREGIPLDDPRAQQELAKYPLPGQGGGAQPSAAGMPSGQTSNGLQWSVEQ